MQRAMLKGIVPPAAIWLVGLITGWLAQCALLPTQFGPLRTHEPMHFVRAGRGRPVDRAATNSTSLEMVIPATPIRSWQLIRDGGTEKTGGAAKLLPFGSDRSLNDIWGCRCSGDIDVNRVIPTRVT